MPKAKGQLRLLLGGDLMLGRAIDAIRPTHNPPEFGKPDARHPRIPVAWAQDLGHTVPQSASASELWGEILASILHSEADLKVFNLETAVTRRSSWVPKTYNFRMHPAGLDVLETAAIECVSLANNHVLDFGLPGLLDTLQALRQRGITVVGAGQSARAAHAPAVFNLAGGQRILVFAVGCRSAGCHSWEAAQPHRPGIAYLPDLEPATRAALCQQIAHYRLPDDLVVVSIHWGENWPQQVPDAMRSFAHSLVEQGGVNVVHGHSSHWPFGIEQHNDALLIYGCGDVFNDYEGRPDLISHRGNLGTIFVVDFTTNPTRLSRWDRLHFRREGFCLRLASNDEASLLDERLRI